MLILNTGFWHLVVVGYVGIFVIYYLIYSLVLMIFVAGHKVMQRTVVAQKHRLYTVNVTRQ